MAMEVETRILDPLKPKHKPLNYKLPRTTTTPTNNAFEIKVVYVRIISARPRPMLDIGPIEMVFPPRADGARLAVNGVEIGPGKATSVALNRNRVDPVMCESIHVSTNTIRLIGCHLCFEIRVGRSCAVVGELQRSREGVLWGMACREGGMVDGEGVAADVYVAGRSIGNAILLNGLVKFSTWKGTESTHEYYHKSTLDDPKVLEEKVMAKEDSGGLSISCYRRNEEEELFEDDEGELSWFNAGVRVGMGLGLGMSLGVGVGAGLIFRGYQAAVLTFRRFI